MCTIVIDEITGLRSGGQLVALRVRGRATDCKRVIVAITSPTPVSGTTDTTPAPGGGLIWAIDLPLSGANIRCEKTRVSITASCEKDENCFDTFEGIFRCIDLPECPALTGIVITNLSCADGMTQPVVTFEASLEDSVTGCTFFWRFGDAPASDPPISSGASPTTNHPYSTPGTYSVSVLITRDGCTPQFTSEDFVIPACCPILSNLRVSQECLPDGRIQATFSVQVDPPSTTGTYRWTFDNAASPQEESSTPAVTHEFQSGGQHHVRATLMPDGTGE